MKGLLSINSNFPAEQMESKLVTATRMTIIAENLNSPLRIDDNW